MAMLVDEIKKQMFAAMRSGDTIAKEILRVARGEIDRAEAQSGSTPSDADIAKILRKLVKSNEETMGQSSDAEQQRTLQRENEILAALLPQTLGVDQIVEHLAAVSDAIRGAGNDGQATGIAMKHVKAAGLEVEGKDVARAVKQLRS